MLHRSDSVHVIDVFELEQLAITMDGKGFLAQVRN